MPSSVRGLFVLLALLSPAAAAAQLTFYEAYEHGTELEEAGRHAEAREAYLAAAAIHPEPEERIKTYGLNFLHRYDPYLRLARVEIVLGQLDEAQAHLDRSAAAAVSPAAEITTLRAALSEARAQSRTAPLNTPTPAPRTATPTRHPPPSPTPGPGHLQIASTPSGAEVFVDGLLVGITPVRIPVEPGPHRIELRADGYQAQVHDLSVGRAATETLNVQLSPLPVPTRPPATIVAEKPAAPTATAAPPTPSPTAAPAEPSPTLAVAQKPGAVPPISVPIWVVVLLAAAVVLGLFLWSTMKRRRQHRVTPTPFILTSDTTIGLSGEILLPDGSSPVFGGYTIRRILGRGGMATTYLAERNRDGIQMALKIPHEHLLNNPEFVERFSREGALGATVHHPNIVRIHEVGQVRSRPFIAMEFIEGVTLFETLESHGAMALHQALELTRGIALALDYAHVKGIIHRDLKPANVMLLPDGSVKVMDFGIAHIAGAPDLTATNKYMGTPQYSAPESLTPAQVDHRSDLYSLGIILYAMLSGRPPFEADNPLRILEMHRNEELPSFAPELAIPPRVEELVRRLTSKAKSDRHPSAEVLLAELNAILNEL